MQLYSEQSFFNSPLFSPPSSVFFSISSLQTFGLTDRLLGRRAHRARSHHVIHTHTLSTWAARATVFTDVVRGSTNRHTHTRTPTHAGRRGVRSGGFWVRAGRSDEDEVGHRHWASSPLTGQHTAVPGRVCTRGDQVWSELILSSLDPLSSIFWQAITA